MTTLCLTSYGHRLVETAPKALASLMGGKHQPDRIILYIAEKDRQFVSDQFKRLPVEIRIVPDYMSHKKFCGLTDRSLDDDFIVIVDDDLHYKEYFWDKLWQKYEQHKDETPFIVCNRAQTISLRKYFERKFVMRDDPDTGRYIFGSGSGLLIPPRTLRIDGDTLKAGFDNFPHCDETYYSLLCLKNGINIVSTGKPQPFYQIPLPKKDPRGLWDKFNKTEKDDTLKRALRYFGLSVNEPITVSFTSWTKRIKYAADVVKRMRRQTYEPSKIILTLAVEEFPNKEADLPKELTILVADDFEIRWTEKNMLTFKKLIPLLDMPSNEWLLIVDDDVDYPDNFIETMLNSAVDDRPVTGSWLRSDYRQYGNILSASGAFTLIKPRHCMPIFSDMSEFCFSVENNLASDPILTYSVLLSGYTFRRASVDFKVLARKSDGKYPAPFSGGDNGRRRCANTHKIIQKFIQKGV